MTYQESTVSEGVCQSHLVIGLIPAACPHKHRDIRVVRMVLQGCHRDAITKLTELQGKKLSISIFFTTSPTALGHGTYPDFFG